MLLEAFVEDRYALEKDIARSTVLLYQCCVRNLESWAGRPVLISDLTDDFINRWLVFLGTTGVAKTTVANHRRFMLALWRHAGGILAGVRPDSLVYRPAALRLAANQTRHDR